MEEVWKPVPGYEGLYEVSDQGRVRNSQKRILALCNVSGGYKAVSLGKNNSKTIHRLVAAAFIGPPPINKYLVLHGDGNRANNSVENLRYGDHRDNASDAVSHGTQVNGERQHAAKLTVDAIYDIRNSRQRTCDLALKYGVTSACVSAVTSGKNWRHV